MSSGPAQDVTTTATWTSSNTAVAIVDAAGHVTHRGTGQAEIRASAQNLIGGTVILVNVSVTSVGVTCVPDGTNYNCTAIANFSNGTTSDVTSTGTAWSSSNTSIATVDSVGRVTPVANGQVEISARFQTTVGGITLTLAGVATVNSITVTCTAQAETTECAAVANRSDGSTQQVTSLAAWTSSNTAVATVDQSGLVRHRTTGQTEIRATYQNVTGSRTLDIVVGFGNSVVINELATRGDLGETQDFIELRNDSANAVDISGWQIREWIANGGSTTTRFSAGAGVILMPGCHYLLSFNGQPVNVSGQAGNGTGVMPDATSGNLTQNGGVALVRADGSVVDQVGFNASSVFLEGNPLTPMGIDDNRSYTRLGNDTNNNAGDFALQPRSPLNSGGSCAVR
jgi:hypothetical protein